MRQDTEAKKTFMAIILQKSGALNKHTNNSTPKKLL